MSFPDIGTVNPAHQLETTSNVKAHSLEIYSDYTFFSVDDYDYARQLRLRVKTPTSTNAFVDMGLEKNSGEYFYISKVQTSAGDPRNNFRIYQNGRILINRTNPGDRTERLQVGGDVKVTGNLNVTGTTTVSSDIATDSLYVPSFSEEKNYIVPEGMIVMWVGDVVDIPPGWELVSDVSGYYLRSNTNQTSVQTGGDASFTISKIGTHTHNLNATTGTPTNHEHNYVSGGYSNNTNMAHTHTAPTGNIDTNNVSHNHNYTEWGGSFGARSNYLNNVTTYAGKDFDSETENASGAHVHNVNFDFTNTGSHNHNLNINNNILTSTDSHSHAVTANGNDTSINVPLTPSYRQVRLIKKLPYV